MAGEHRDWTRHGPGRSLLWWPFCSFALMALFPDAGILPIVASGAGLALLGLLGALGARMVGRWIRQRGPSALTSGASDVGGAVVPGALVEDVETRAA